MIITLSPVRMDMTLTASLAGEVLVLNGTAYDFSALHEGETQLPPDCPWMAGPVTRQAGRLRVMLILPHGPAAPQETLFPQPVSMDKDGPVPLPPYDTAEV